MQIVESIGGIGCVARDTVQNVGTDLLFLSNTGVRSFGRTIQEKSMPVNDVTKNVRDYLLGALSSETKANIKSVYSPVDGFYLLSLPVRGITLCIDIRQILPDGSLRVTEWSVAPIALARDKDSVVYMGDASYIKKYDKYLDNVLSDASGGSTYEFKWTGGWTDINPDVSPFLKIPKRVTLLMGGVSGANATIRWWFDYRDTGYSSSVSFPSGQVAMYGVSQYGIDSYSGDISFKEGQSAMSSAGQVVKFGISTTVNGTKVIMQSFSIISKIGRIAV